MRLWPAAVLSLMLLFCSAPVARPADDDNENQSSQRAGFYSFGEGVAAGMLITGKARVFAHQRNIHEPSEKDRYERISSRGIDLVVHRVAPRKYPNAPPYPEQLTIRRQGFWLPGGLRVGKSNRRDVENLLGPPKKTEESSWTYDSPDDGPCWQGYTLQFKGDTLMSVAWHWCLD
jgi:hypothetical protein